MEGKAKQIRKYAKECCTYQKTKAQNGKPMRLLIPLPTLEVVWWDLNIDFITHLPKDKGKSIIIVVVDRLLKFCHLKALLDKFTSNMAASYFLFDIIRLHGIPSSLVLDRDKVFIGSFWREINRLSGTKLKLPP